MSGSNNSVVGLDPQHRAQFTETIFVATISAVGSFGDKTYGTPVSRTARVQLDEQVVETADGNFLRTTHLIATETRLGKRDRIWLPGDSSSDDTLARLPAQIKEAKGERGDVEHYEVRV